MTKSNNKELVVPEAGAWTFQNANVAENFDKHVKEQLPWYELATDIVTHVGRHYLGENGLMYDIGASTGNVTRALESEIVGRNVEAVSIDNSEAMRTMWRGVSGNGGGFCVADAVNYSYEPYDFTACFLVLMFLTPERQRLLVDKLVKKIKEGGALLIFDKTEAVEGYVGTVMHRLTMAGKLKTGTSADDIIKKEMSLAGVQRPIVPSKLLTRHNAVEIFRFGEFAGWIIQGI